MIQQGLKDVLFGLSRHLTRPGAYAAAVRYRRKRPLQAEGHFLHLGCGAHYIPGMINVDGNLFRKVDLWLDLRNPLPFPDASCGFVYSSHTLEHLFPYDALRLLAEVRRVLSPDGLARIAVPSVEHALEIAEGRHADLWPRSFDDPVAQAVNYLFCDGQHKYAYNFSILSQFAAQAGFTRIHHYSASHGVTPRTYGPVTVGDEPLGSLVVELAP